MVIPVEKGLAIVCEPAPLDIKAIVNLFHLFCGAVFVYFPVILEVVP